MATHSLPFPAIDGVTFRHVPGFPGYAVTDDGRVWSCKRRGEWRPIKPDKDRKDYLRVLLRRDGQNHKRHIHRLILEAFVGPRPEGMECCHGPGGKQDNSLKNLRWDTHVANVDDLRKEGRLYLKRGGSHLRSGRGGSTKLTADQVREIRALRGQLSQSKIAKQFGVCQQLIHKIQTGQVWQYLA